MRLARGDIRSGKWLMIAAAAAVSATAFALVGGEWTQALFTTSRPVGADVAAARIFRAERESVAFSIVDRSAGAAVDGSSPIAYQMDGRYAAAGPWATAFGTDRYIELEFNRPLPAGLAASSVTLSVRVAAEGSAATTCYYAELRRASSGGVLSSHGSPAAPLACVSGTSFSTSQVNLGAVTDTDVANDLRVRLYLRDSAAGAALIDALTVSGETSYAPFTLYPILTRQALDGPAELVRWKLAGP